MTELRKITVNVPADILADAKQITGKGITDTIIDGLRELQRSNKRSALRRTPGQDTRRVGPRGNATVTLVDTSPWIEFFEDRESGGSVNLAEASWVFGRVGPGLRGHDAHVTAFHSANARVRSTR